MSTGSTMTSNAKQAVHDKIQSKILAAQSKIDTLKVKAEAAKAIAELKAIADVVAKKKTIDQKLSALKASPAESKWEQAKTDIESHVADLEKSVQAIEARFKPA